jgi:3-carboxy-cis,cis-muconate cycloisomerase
LPSDELFAPLFVPDALREAVSGEAWLRRMLDAERALALALAGAGVIPGEEADAVAAACDASRFDLASIAVEGRRAGNPAEPLARALRVESGVERAHWGATSQDIVDTAAMLVARDARALIFEELDGLARACAALAEEHRGTVMAARTLLRQAVPTTFGLKAAGWLVGVLESWERLRTVELQAQLGGAGGTLALLGDRGPDVLAEYSRELGLSEPTLSWHSMRVRVVELVGALDLASGVGGKICLDVALLAQDEVEEVSVADPGGSSTMPHKRNPVAAVLGRACARRVGALAGTFTLAHEHERAAGAWQAEWEPLSDLLALTGAAAAWARAALEGIEVSAERMRENLRPETLAEAGRLGGELPAPEGYLGSAELFVDRALARYRGWIEAER